jgi:hypothetical protein
MHNTAIPQCGLPQTLMPSAVHLATPNNMANRNAAQLHQIAAHCCWCVLLFWPTTSSASAASTSQAWQLKENATPSLTQLHVLFVRTAVLANSYQRISNMCTHLL